jgi:hypothetical protein
MKRISRRDEIGGGPVDRGGPINDRVRSERAILDGFKNISDEYVKHLLMSIKSKVEGLDAITDERLRAILEEKRIIVQRIESFPEQDKEAILSFLNELLKECRRSETLQR